MGIHQGKTTMKQRGSLIVLALCAACVVIVAFLSPASDSLAQNQWNQKQASQIQNIAANISTTESNSISSDTPETNLDLVESLELIKQKMAKARFCYNESCVYRNITSKITPPARDDQPYTATISAAMSRPSASPDLADYHFVYEPLIYESAANESAANQKSSNQKRTWHLVKGEEFTDVADFVFVGDHYEIYGVHSNRVQRGNLTPDISESNIKAGYLTLYYQILDQGWQR